MMKSPSNYIKQMMDSLDVRKIEHCGRDSDICMSCCSIFSERVSCCKHYVEYPVFTDKKEAKVFKVLGGMHDERLAYGLDQCLEECNTIKEALAKFIVEQVPVEHPIRQEIKEILEKKEY